MTPDDTDDSDQWQYTADAEPVQNSADEGTDSTMPARAAGAAVIGGTLLGLMLAMLILGNMDWAFRYAILLVVFAIAWDVVAFAAERRQEGM